MRIFFLLILATFLVFDCGSSKKDLIIEDETDESIHGRALIAYEAGQYREAFRYDSLLLIHFPISDLHIEAQLNMANALGGQERYEDQLDLLLRLLGENIIPEAVPKIYVQIGEHYEHAAVWNPNDITNDTTDWEKAASYYRKAVFYPNSNDRVVKAQALYRAGLMYAKINNFEYATNAYNEVINSFPESPYSTLAKIKLQDPSNTSEIGFESDTAQQLEDDRKSVIESVVEEPVQEPDQFGIITPEDSTVQMEIVAPEADTGSEPQIDSGMEMPEMEDEAQDPALPDSSAMEEF